MRRRIMGELPVPRIKSSVTALITPAVPTAPGNLHLALSNVDLADLRIFTPVILLYEGQDSSFKTVVETLKDALRKVLVAFYPLAGRIARREENDGVAEIRCDDSGVYFTEMVVEDELAALGGRDACAEVVAGMVAAKLKQEGFNLYSLQDYDEIPPLVIQITSFKCKTIALAVNWHHMVADGTSGTSFLKAWSQVAQGVPISSLPDHRRHLMSARVPPEPYEGCPPGYKLVSPQQNPSAEIGNRKKERKKVEFTVSQSEIQLLKKKAAEENPSIPFTSGELISAHLWKLVTTARNLNKEDSTVFYSVLDGRKRMKDIPEGFFGNCIFCRTAIASVAEVVEMPLSCVAIMIRDSISNIPDAYFRSVLDWLEVMGPQHVAHDRPNLGTHDLNATFWRYFPIYELDFGFGKPFYGGRNNPRAGRAGFAVVSPTPDDDGSVAITVFLYPDAADALAATLKLDLK